MASSVNLLFALLVGEVVAAQDERRGTRGAISATALKSGQRADRAHGPDGRLCQATGRRPYAAARGIGSTKSVPSRQSA